MISFFLPYLPLLCIYLLILVFPRLYRFQIFLFWLIFFLFSLCIVLLCLLFALEIFHLDHYLKVLLFYLFFRIPFESLFCLLLLMMLYRPQFLFLMLLRIGVLFLQCHLYRFLICLLAFLISQFMVSPFFLFFLTCIPYIL